MFKLSTWVRHVRRASWPGGPLAIRLGVAVLLAALIAGLYLAQASQMSATGRRLEALRAQLVLLKQENTDLLCQIAQEGSIVRLQQRSADMGLIPAEKIEYLVLDAQPSLPNHPTTSAQP